MRAIVLVAVIGCAQAAAAAPREDTILIQGLAQGKQTVTTVDANTTTADYSYNDRGRGDHITATWKLDAAGVPVEYSGAGNDYMKAAVEEKFSFASGKATWTNRTEHGDKAVSGEAFYIPLNGPPELFGVQDRVDILTGTLGKALGGASGGYTAAHTEIVEMLRQRSRPYLFSNSLAPSITAAGIAMLDLLETSGELLQQLRDNTAYFRSEMVARGFEIPESDHPIVPIMIGDAVEAAAMADRLLAEGIYVRAFSYPVVPRGKARIRTQISAAHSRDDLDQAITAFEKVRR